MGESSNEGAVKVAKAQKRAYVPDLGWRWPVLDARNFNGVHTSHPFFKNYPQVIDTGRVESAFFGFEVEVVFYLKPEKCTFHSSSVNYLGVILEKGESAFFGFEVEVVFFE